jgi:hypothetical protein
MCPKHQRKGGGDEDEEEEEEEEEERRINMMMMMMMMMMMVVVVVVVRVVRVRVMLVMTMMTMMTMLDVTTTVPSHFRGGVVGLEARVGSAEARHVLCARHHQDTTFFQTTHPNVQPERTALDQSLPLPGKTLNEGGMIILSVNFSLEKTS